MGFGVWGFGFGVWGLGYHLCTVSAALNTTCGMQGVGLAIEHKLAEARVRANASTLQRPRNTSRDGLGGFECRDYLEPADMASWIASELGVCACVCVCVLCVCVCVCMYACMYVCM